MRHILILLSFLLLSSPLFGQSERPETIVIPVGTLGDISDSRKQIIQNTLSQELTKYFRLVPQDKFGEAQEKVFEELEYEECTEDQCIIRIQELLKVENAFSLQLVVKDSETELSLTWVGLEEKKVLIESCEECNTKFSVDSDIVSPELNSKIKILVKRTVRQIGNIAKVDKEPEEDDSCLDKEIDDSNLIYRSPQTKIDIDVTKIFPLESEKDSVAWMADGAVNQFYLKVIDTDSGEILNGKESHSIGLLTHLCDNDEAVRKTAEILAEWIAEKPPNAIRMTKQWLNELDGSLDDSLFDPPAESSAAAISEETRALLQAIWDK